MRKLKQIIRKHQERLVIGIQLVLCAIFAGKAINKEVKQRLKFSEKNAKQEEKRTRGIKKSAAKYAKKLAKAEYKLKSHKLKAKLQRDKALTKLAMRKLKEKARKKKLKNKKRK
ncbi:MAG: hypothetical protein NC086_05690 [Alistipes sp.]|nr:hypothetical protein [Alistipes sp.]